MKVTVTTVTVVCDDCRDAVAMDPSRPSIVLPPGWTSRVEPNLRVPNLRLAMVEVHRCRSCSRLKAKHDLAFDLDDKEAR